MVVVFPPK
ncbi:rCG46791, partial [Rattus norvegicus]